MTATKTDARKPPYRVPSMAEIAALPWNGFKVASLFSGCGGSSLGYKMAGFKVIWANEFIPAAQEVYRINHPGTVLDPRDIRLIRSHDILGATGLAQGELDILDGSPPCASFSTAGKRSRDWGKVKKYSDTKQRTDDLFFEYARLVRGIRPKVFVAENVSGLVKGVAKGYFLDILKELKSCGYRVEARVLDAQWLGVPQMRQRLIFVGVRNDLGRKPAFPKPLPYRYSVRDALPWVVSLRHDSGGHEGSRVFNTATEPVCTIRQPGGGGAQVRFTVEEAVGFRGHRQRSIDEPIQAIQASRAVNDVHGPIEPETDISRFAIGREWEKLQPGEHSNRYLNLSRPDPERPCPTVTAPAGLTSAATVTHPTEKRRFSIAELKRICAFPDDFELRGTYARQWERLGRAVPPLMMFQIARAVRDEVLS